MLKPIDIDCHDLDFSCDDPEAVELMLEFMYLNDYRTKALSVTRTVLKKLKAPETSATVQLEGEEPDIRYTMFDEPEYKPKPPEETILGISSSSGPNGTIQTANANTNLDEDDWGFDWGATTSKKKSKKKKKADEEGSTVANEPKMVCPIDSPLDVRL